jgi:hypothetical protein
MSWLSKKVSKFRGWVDETAQLVRDNSQYGQMINAHTEAERAVIAAQAAADARPDEFDKLLRNAMFATLDDVGKGRKNTFYTGPRGLNGPFKTILG